jgi:uncharacterized membrane protein
VGLIAGMLVFLAWAWPQLPERVAVHWNVAFQADSWRPRGHLLLLPGLALGIWAGMPLLRRIDPRRADYARWDATFWLVVNLIVLFMAVLHVALIGFNLGWPLDMHTVILSVVGLVFVGLGNYMPRVRRNWWVGFRTPWTLSSERVWRQTHRLGGRVLVLGGLMFVVGAFVPRPAAPWVALPGVLLIVLVPTVYSYILWRREDVHGQNDV